jgi:hypothetical protein
MTPMQERFAQEVASGKSQAAAYRIAYPKSQKWKDATVWRKASLLMGHGDVSARVDAIRAELAALNLWSREQSVKALAEIAGAGEKASDKVSAIKELNAMHGYNAPQKIEHGGGLVVQIIRFADADQAP